GRRLRAAAREWKRHAIGEANLLGIRPTDNRCAGARELDRANPVPAIIVRLDNGVHVELDRGVWRSRLEDRRNQAHESGVGLKLIPGLRLKSGEASAKFGN